VVGREQQQILGLSRRTLMVERLGQGLGETDHPIQGTICLV